MRICGHDASSAVSPARDANWGSPDKVDTKISKVVHNTSLGGMCMTKERQSYSREYKLEAVRLLETSGRSGAQLERKLGIGSGCLCRWQQQFAEEGEQAFPGHGRLAPDQGRIRRLELRTRFCVKSVTS